MDGAHRLEPAARARLRRRPAHRATWRAGPDLADPPAGHIPGDRPAGAGRPDQAGERADLDEIAAQANDTEYGLGAGIWTKDISKAHALAKKIRAGTVWINCYNVFDASLPFGGYKQSGWGREMGHEALEAYTEVKAVTTQL